MTRKIYLKELERRSQDIETFKEQEFIPNGALGMNTSNEDMHKIMQYLNTNAEKYRLSNHEIDNISSFALKTNNANVTTSLSDLRSTILFLVMVGLPCFVSIFVGVVYDWHPAQIIGYVFVVFIFTLIIAGTIIGRLNFRADMNRLRRGEYTAYKIPVERRIKREIPDYDGQIHSYYYFQSKTMLFNGAYEFLITLTCGEDAIIISINKNGAPFLLVYGSGLARGDWRGK